MLCSSNQNQNVLLGRYTLNKSKQMLLQTVPSVEIEKKEMESNRSFKECKWRFEKVSSREPFASNNSYTIWNMAFDRALYASANLLFKTPSVQRGVYLWNHGDDEKSKKSIVNNKQFTWSLDCSKSFQLR